MASVSVDIPGLSRTPGSAAPRPADPPKVVPPCRDEIRLLPAAHNRDGSPAWMIQDPVTNRFYRIDWMDFEILSRWQLRSIDAIVSGVNSETTLDIEAEDVDGLIQFLVKNHLTQVASSQDVSRLIKENQSSQRSLLSWLIHHYLFFRIPLIRPQALLARLAPYLRWIFSPVIALLVLAATLLGLFMVSRQWDVFSATLVDQLTFSGALGFAVALLFSKVLHEFGHAITATIHGVRVAHMGIAMVVMFPMPYTDTSESWKLSKAHQRLQIASAGIVAELALAGIATLAWTLTPDGALRGALFFLATTSWLLTLAVNISPFMRFDGYFILSDWLDFPNLHERSAALARTWMRRTFLGFNEPWPEEFPRRSLVGLIVFATVTWIYRLTVFIAIAWLVYYYFFKVLGIFLFAVEILWFVILPIGREISVWFKRKAEIKRNRWLWATVGLFALLGLGMMPWQSTIHGAAWLHTLRHTAIYSPIPGKLIEAAKPGAVKKGDRLFRLDSPDLALDAARSQGLSDARALELRGLLGIEGGEAQRTELQFQRDKFTAEVKLYKDELSRLDITAPFDGVLRDVDDGLSKDGWVHPKHTLGILIDPASWIVDVLVPEEEIHRVKPGDRVDIYFLRSQLDKLKGHVSSVDTSRLATLPHAMLDAQSGGAVTTLPGDKRTPSAALYRVRVALDSQPDFAQMATGRAAIHSSGSAWLPTQIDRMLALLIRESGF